VSACYPRSPESGELEGDDELTAKAKGGEGTRSADATLEISVEGEHGQTQVPDDPGEPPEKSPPKQ
jgi:hypothetical protein